jgi:hypothetical protein
MLQKVVEILCQKTHWKKPVASQDGSYSFTLENDLGFKLFSLDGSHLFMESTLFTPADGVALDADRAIALLKINAAKAGNQKSVLALKEKDGTLALFQKISLKDTPAESILDTLERFLNDVAFWQAQMATGATTHSFTPPFSLHG